MCHENILLNEIFDLCYSRIRMSMHKVSLAGYIRMRCWVMFDNKHMIHL